MGPINLTAHEQALWDKIYFVPASGGSGHDKLRASIEPAYQLARSLLERKAIPPVRWRYFTDPELNTGGRGKSRKEILERNGTRGEAILKHPHFHKYLRYFVLGPELPSSAIDEFARLVRDCEPVTSGDMNGLCSLARQQARSGSLSRQAAAEEYFKLGLELGLGVDMSRALRKNLMDTKMA